MKPEATTNGNNNPAWAWLSFVLALALTIPLIWRAWTIVGPNTYQAADGKAWQSVIREVIEFAPAFQVNILSPLAGAAGFGTPINVWANPIYWPFFSDDLLFATQASTLIAYLALATAIFVLSRIWRLPLGASIAGSLSGIIIFPPFSNVFGFAGLLMIVPDAAMGAASMIITAGISYCVNDWQWRSIIRGALLLALWLGFIVYSNLTWFVGAGFVFAPLIAFCILDGRSAQVITARAAAFAIAFVLLYALGPLEYARTLFAYSSRIYFSSESMRPQDVLYASGFFWSPQLLWSYCFLLLGWMLGMIFGNRSERKVALVCVLLLLVFLIEASVFLFAPLHWLPTMPLYYEVLNGPIYALGAVVGYNSSIATVWRELAAPSLKPLARVPSHGRFASVCYFVPTSSIALVRLRRLLSWKIAHHEPLKNAMLAVPVLSGIAFIPLVGVWYVKDEVYAHRYTANLINTLTEPWPATDELAAYLGDNIGLRNTRQFRGMLLMNGGFSYDKYLVHADLWRSFVPTMDAYDTFDSSRFHYFISHLPLTKGAGSISSFGTIPVQRAEWTHAHLDASSSKMLQAWGVRYVIHARLDGEEAQSPPDGAVVRGRFGPTTVGAQKIVHSVYEYTHFNMGNYSPTNVIAARDAPWILHYLWRDSFDLRESIILPQKIEESLVQANSGKMSFERGAIRVQAESRGHSLLLLPLQYSHCLVPSEPVKVTLLPANLVQTAVLFQGSIDLRISFEYGLFSPGCRRQDLADLAELGIFDEKDGTAWAELHPHAISTVADLPRAVWGVVKKLATLVVREEFKSH
jgi:hypothetical protein